MPVTLTSAISALDKPSSLIPFFVKDAFDITGRTVMANNESGKHEAREKFIEEAGTSLFWIGGIPAVRAIANKIYKNKLDTNIHYKRINSNGPQSYFAKNIQGVELGGEKLTQIGKKLASEGLEKYKHFHVRTSIAAVSINLFMLTFALPMFNQLLSRKIIKKEVEQNKQSDNSFDKIQFSQNEKNKSNSKQQAFGSLASLKDFVNVKDLFNFTKMAEDAQLNVTSSMLLLDYGISGSRVTFIPRDNNERIEYAIKEGGIIFFFYFAADLIKKGLSKIANKVFKTPIDLDYKVMKDAEFAKGMHNSGSNLESFHFAKIQDFDAKEAKKAGKLGKEINALEEAARNSNELSIIKFIDSELQNTKGIKDKNTVFKNFTLKMAQKEGLIDIEYGDSLDKWIRHSEKYIETDKLVDLNKNLKTFFENATASGLSMDKIIAKTKGIKAASVFTNIAICCASLSVILPSIQYAIREHRTKTNRAPGIKLYQEMAEKNELKV